MPTTFDRLPIGASFIHKGCAYVKRCAVSAESLYSFSLFGASDIITL